MAYFKKANILAVSLVIILAIGVIAVFYIIMKSQYDLERVNYSQDIKRLSNDLKRLQQERDELAVKTEKLRKDTLNFIEMNNRLKDEKTQAANQLNQLKNETESSGALLKEKEEKILQLSQDLKTKYERAIDELVQNAKIRKLNQALTTQEQLNLLLKSTVLGDRAKFHYNLGVAFSQAGMYDQAIFEYEEALKAQATNSDAHYNLALLYEKIKKDYPNAIKHYQLYLELRPDAADRQDVLTIIDGLK